MANRGKAGRATANTLKTLYFWPVLWQYCGHNEEHRMRSPVHTSTVKFRADEALVAAAAEQARRQGMTLSELLRQAVRREVRELAR